MIKSKGSETSDRPNRNRFFLKSISFCLSICISFYRGIAQIASRVANQMTAFAIEYQYDSILGILLG